MKKLLLLLLFIPLVSCQNQIIKTYYDSEIPAIGNNAKAANGRTILESITAGGIGSKGSIDRTDSNDKIKAVIEGIISDHIPAELAKELSNNPDIYGPTTIKQVPNFNPSTIQPHSPL
jgi:hypothetical protein